MVCWAWKKPPGRAAGREANRMIAVILKDASAEEIAALVLAVQERQKQEFVPCNSRTGVNTTVPRRKDAFPEDKEVI